jgi:hypothetical protein
MAMGSFLKRIGGSAEGLAQTGLRVWGATLAGGALGYLAQRDTQSETQKMEGAFLGAGLGAAGGLLFTKTAANIAWAGAKSIGRNLPHVLAKNTGRAYRGVRAAGSLASSTLGFISEHPKAAVAIGALGLGAGGIAYSGKKDMNSPASATSAYVQALGEPSTGFDPGDAASVRQADRLAFEGSTAGLVQGLHRRRHS